MRCLRGSCNVACTLQCQALADKTIAADALPVGMERFQQSFGHKPFHQVPRPPFADLQMAAHINGVHRAVFPKREPYYFAFKQLIGAHLCQGAGTPSVQILPKNCCNTCWHVLGWSRTRS